MSLIIFVVICLIFVYSAIKVIEIFNGPYSVKEAIEKALVEWTKDSEKFWMSEKTILERKLLQLQDDRYVSCTCM